jgi:hypothetical protein
MKRSNYGNVPEFHVRNRSAGEDNSRTCKGGGHTLNDSSYIYTFVTINTKGISTISREYYVIKDIVSIISRLSLHERSCQTTLLHFSIPKHTNIETDQCGLTIVTRAGVHCTQTNFHQEET